MMTSKNVKDWDQMGRDMGTRRERIRSEKVLMKMKNKSKGSGAGGVEKRARESGQLCTRNQREEDEKEEKKRK